MGSLHNATKKIGFQKKNTRNEEEGGVLQSLHIQAFEACATKQHHLLKSDEHHELFGQRPLSSSCKRGKLDCPEEQEGNTELERDTDCSKASLSRGAGQTRLR